MIKHLKNWLLPSIADVLFISVLLYLALLSDNELLSDGDTGYHIRAGEFILNTLSIPKADIFSFITPAIPWTAHEWLSEVIMAFLHQLGGLNAVVIAFSFMIAASAWIFFKIVRTEGNNILLSVVATIMFVALAKVHWLARPHIFSLVILLVWYRLLDDFQYRQQSRLWLLPFIMLLWVNLHGGFIIGLAIAGVYFAGNFLLLYTDKKQWEISGKEKTRVLGRILGISIFACLANPVGYHIFLFPFNLVSNKFIMDHTSEFLSPNFHELQPFKYLLLFLIIVIAYSKKKPNFIEVVLILLFMNMSLYSIRYIPLFAVIVIPILFRYINSESFVNSISFIRQRIENITSVDDMATGYLWPALSIVFLLYLTVNGTVTHAFNPDKKPMAALEFLRENQVTGNMFNNDEFGDCIIYSSHQQYKVFIDGRGDMYGSDMLKEYCRIINFEPGWESILDKYKITWVFFDTNSVLSRHLMLNDDWKLIYSDKVASIFLKNIPTHKLLIDKFPNVKLSLKTSNLNDKL